MDLSGYSDEQLKQIAGINSAPAQDLSKYSDEDLAKIAGIPSKPGFIDRIGADLTNRANEGADAIVAYKAGDQGLAQTGLQLAGKMGAGAANDIVGEVVNSATPDVVKQGLATGAQKTANAIDSTSVGQKIGDLLLNAKDAYGNFANNNPNAVRSLESAANIATALPLAKTVESTALNISDIGRGAEGLSNVYAGKYPGETPMQEITPKVAYPANPDALAAASTLKYQQMRDAGASLNQNGIDLVNNSVGQALKNSGLMNERLHGDTMSVVSDLKSDASSGSLDLEKLDQYRQLLGNVVTDNTTKLEGMNQDAMKAQTAIGAIDNAVDSLGSSHIVGGQQYTKPNLDSAIDEWGKLKELERHLTNTVNGTAEFAGKNQRGFWRQQSITNAAEDAKNLANVKQQIASQESNISNIEQNLANAPQAESKAKQALDALNQARALYTGKARLQTVQRIIDNAYMTDNPATAMRTGFKNLAKQVNVSPRGWSAEEVAAINNAAKTGIVTGALKTMGGRLMSGVVGGIGGGVGGGIPGAMAGAAIGEGIGYPMRIAANSLQEGRGKAVANLVMQRPAIMQALPQDIKDIMQLPPAQAKAALQNLRMQQLQQAIPLKK